MVSAAEMGGVQNAAPSTGVEWWTALPRRGHPDDGDVPERQRV